MALLALQRRGPAAQQFRAARDAGPNGKYAAKAVEQLKLCGAE